MAKSLPSLSRSDLRQIEPVEVMRRAVIGLDLKEFVRGEEVRTDVDARNVADLRRLGGPLALQQLPREKLQGGHRLLRLHAGAKDLCAFRSIKLFRRTRAAAEARRPGLVARGDQRAGGLGLLLWTAGADQLARHVVADEVALILDRPGRSRRGGSSRYGADGGGDRRLFSPRRSTRRLPITCSSRLSQDTGQFLLYGRRPYSFSRRLRIGRWFVVLKRKALRLRDVPQRCPHFVTHVVQGVLRVEQVLACLHEFGGLFGPSLRIGPAALLEAVHLTLGVADLRPQASCLGAAGVAAAAGEVIFVLCLQVVAAVFGLGDKMVRRIVLLVDPQVQFIVLAQQFLVTFEQLRIAALCGVIDVFVDIRTDDREFEAPRLAGSGRGSRALGKGSKKRLLGISHSHHADVASFGDSRFLAHRRRGRRKRPAPPVAFHYRCTPVSSGDGRSFDGRGGRRLFRGWRRLRGWRKWPAPPVARENLRSEIAAGDGRRQPLHFRLEFAQARLDRLTVWMVCSRAFGDQSGEMPVEGVVLRDAPGISIGAQGEKVRERRRSRRDGRRLRRRGSRGGDSC